MAAIGAIDVTRIARYVAEEKALPMKVIGAVVARGTVAHPTAPQRRVRGPLGDSALA